MTNALYEYWVFPNEINKSVCDKIINAPDNDWKTAKVYKYTGGDHRVDKKERITDVAWCNERWLYDLVWTYLEIANKNANWNFQIDSCEAMQVAKYKKEGHFKFHQDGNGFTRFDNSNKFTNGKTRKLSMSIILNEEYKGGDFEFFNEDTQIKDKTGTIIVFPSYMIHKVNPVLSGTRYSLVTWFCGEPFR